MHVLYFPAKELFSIQSPSNHHRHKRSLEGAECIATGEECTSAWAGGPDCCNGGKCKDVSGAEVTGDTVGWCEGKGYNAIMLSMMSM